MIWSGRARIVTIYVKTCKIDNVVSYLEILDTAGQEDFSALRDQWVREGNAFLLVFSCTSRDSLRELNAFRERIFLVNEEREVGNIPMALVCNKTDLASERVVSKQDGEHQAAEWGIPYIECSALKGRGCEEAFFTAIREVRRIEKANGLKDSGKKSKKGSRSFLDWCTIL